MVADIPNFEIFRNAPIKEAIIDIQVEPFAKDIIEKLDELHSVYKITYPIKKEIKISELAWNFDPEKNHVGTNSYLHGYQMWAPDEKELITCRFDGFSYNKLKPYDKWQTSLDKAISGWELFKANLGSRTIRKLVVRNINIIEIPGIPVNLEEYLNVSLPISEGVAESLANFFARSVLNFENDAKGLLTISSAPPSREGYSAIMLDIEAFQESNIIEDNIAAMLTQLNGIKDRLFFGSITEKAKELFR